MEDIREFTKEELSLRLKAMGEPSYRSSQIYDWVHKKHVSEFDSMTNLSKKTRERLSEDFYITKLRAVSVLRSELDGTRKYILALGDGNVIEAVLMRYSYGNSVCISSQVGCRMGCRFCASTLGGLVRNLSAAEMLSEVYTIEDDTGERVSHIVIMGSGEPLDNYDEVVRFLRMVSDGDGINISQRNITLSTCGIVPRIYELSKLRLQITLALSLHASTQEKRMNTMPIAKAYELSEVLKACRHYIRETGRRLTLEYALAKGVNDSMEDADLLSSIAKDLGAHINLIPVNPVEECGFSEPSRENLIRFRERLEKAGANVTVRREMGRDIDSACGQLRRRYMIDAGLCTD